MISFASSIWLWAIAGIVIPVLIHLWNVRRGKTLKIGSIGFFTETAVSRASSLQLTDLLLLLLRCLIFVLLAMFIAGPSLLTRVSTKDKGWIVVAKNNLAAAHDQYGQEIDSLLAVGMELHEFGNSFGPMEISDSTVGSMDSSNNWTLLHQLQKYVTPGLPIRLYTDQHLSRFEGARPVLNLNLSWKFISTDQQFSWIEHAYSTYDDSVLVVRGKTGPLQTLYRHEVVSKLDPIVQYGTLTVNTEGIIVPIDTSPVHLVVFSDQGTDDGKYLAGAVEAAKAFTKRKISIRSTTDSSAVLDADWLFWLSLKKIPGTVRVKNIFRYAGEDRQQVTTHFQSDNEFVPLYQLYSDPGAKLERVGDLRTGSGALLLGFDQARNSYLFYSRLDPKWTEWVWTTQFPKFITEIIFPMSAQKGRDLRLIDGQQVPPVIKGEPGGKPGSTRKDVSTWFWLLAMLLFIAERLISFRKQRLANG